MLEAISQIDLRVDLTEVLSEIQLIKKRVDGISLDVQGISGISLDVKKGVSGISPSLMKVACYAAETVRLLEDAQTIGTFIGSSTNCPASKEFSFNAFSRATSSMPSPEQASRGAGRERSFAPTERVVFQGEVLSSDALNGTEGVVFQAEVLSNDALNGT